MRKILAICLTLIVVFSMSIAVFAEPGAFVESPSANGAPTLIEEHSDDGVKITAYRNRALELNTAQVEDFEKAYKSIVGVADLTSLVEEVGNVATELQVGADDLAVSDLFYISLVSGADSFNGTSYNVRLQSDTFVNFVCLLRMEDGEWKIVSEAEVIDSQVIEFVAEEIGSYAVVVSIGDAPIYPQPGGEDQPNVWFIIEITLATLAIVAGVFFIIMLIHKSKHDDGEEEQG